LNDEMPSRSTNLDRSLLAPVRARRFPAAVALLAPAMILAAPGAASAQAARATPAGSPARIGAVAPRPAAAPDHEPRLRPGRSLTAGRTALGAGPNVARSPNVGPGTRVRHLPGPFTRFRHRGRIFYYCLGGFYVTGSAGYEVVEAPIGAVVHRLPTGYETLEVGGERFYYYDGVFYAPGRRTGEYVVVSAPPGAVVDELPHDAVEVTMNGRRLFEARGVYYVSIRRDGRLSWVVTTR
jgi:hypothetical protein